MERMNQLYEMGAVSAVKRDEAAAAYQAAVAASSASASYDSNVVYDTTVQAASPEAIKKAELQLRQAQAALERAKGNAAATEITAPVDGTVYIGELAEGMEVQAGQVLLGGVADSPRGCRYMRAHGRIRARTGYCWTVPVPLDVCEKTGEEGAVTRVAVDIGRQRIKLYAGGSVLPVDCDRITEYRGLRLPFGLRLPVTLAVEKTVTHTVYDGQRAEDDARAEGERQLLAQLRQTIGEDGAILQTDVSARRQGAYLMVTLRAECEEQIGVDAPLAITSDTGR